MRNHGSFIVMTLYSFESSEGKNAVLKDYIRGQVLLTYCYKCN